MHNHFHSELFFSIYQIKISLTATCERCVLSFYHVPPKKSLAPGSLYPTLLRQRRLQVVLSHRMFARLNEATSISLCVLPSPERASGLCLDHLFIHLYFVTSVPKLASIFQIQVQPHMSQVEGNSHFPWLADSGFTCMVSFATAGAHSWLLFSLSCTRIQKSLSAELLLSQSVLSLFLTCSWSWGLVSKSPLSSFSTLLSLT